MAPNKTSMINQATSDRRLRLRVRNRPAEHSPAPAAAVKNVKTPTKSAGHVGVTDNDVFTFIVGNKGNGTVFKIKYAALKKCPTFASMCGGSYLESQTQTVGLPDDDAKFFAFLVEYLKSPGTGVPEIVIASRRKWKRVENLGGLYILANKYRVAELEEHVVVALEDVYHFDHDVFRSKDAIDLLDVAVSVYKNVAGINDTFKMWFRAMIPTILKDANDEVMNQVAEIVNDGDDLAVDLCLKMFWAWRVDRKMVLAMGKVISNAGSYD